MKLLFGLVLGIGLTSCSSNAGSENLEKYREPVLRFLVKERIQAEVAPNPRFKTISIWDVPGTSLMLFQRDNVDRSRATFKLQGKDSQSIECGVYIREVANNTNQLAVNLLECKGDQAKELSGGEYGLRGLTVNKSAL